MSSLRYVLLLALVAACSDPDPTPATVDGSDTGDSGPVDTGPDAANNGVPDVPVPDVPRDAADVPDEGGNNGNNGDNGNNGNNGDPTCASDAECGDGAAFCRLGVGQCDDPNARGECTPRPRACPGALEPVCGCDDRTWRNECQAAQAGVSLRHDGACRDDPVRCETNDECPDGAFCECSGDACAPAVCVASPAECDREAAPVCGCDGVTYTNDCERQAAGVCQSGQGACPPQECGGILGRACPDGQVCDLLEGACGVADLPGTCVDAPADCALAPPGPVCGCDAATYANDCLRLVAGVPRDHEGACVIPACTASDECGANEYCDVPDGCARDASGTCELSPQDCTGEPEARVCGCDERTYDNDCERRQAGVGKLADGRCGAQACSARTECDRGREFCQLDWCVDPDSAGICLETPRECLAPRPGQEVCGCDGETYESDCLRQRARVSLFSEGRCAVCSFVLACGRGTFCEYGGGVCGAPRSTGLCADIPTVCPRDVDPVCGCDGRTYTNDCNRRAQGVALDHTGSCR